MNGKRNVVDSYGGIVFSHKKDDVQTHTITQMNLEATLSARSKPFTKDYIVYGLIC